MQDSKELTCPYTPQQNGVAERKNKHLAEICRSMMHAKNVPGRFWAECMRTTAHIINRLPQQRMGYMSPFEMLWNMKPTVSHFKVFGCVCYVFVPDHLRSKFDKKAIKCIFVGYDESRKGWRCCDPTTGRCHVSRNVVFDEASSWWKPEYVALPNSKEAEEQMQEKFKDIQQSSATESPQERPWQTGTYHRAESENHPITETLEDQPVTESSE